MSYMPPEALVERPAYDERLDSFSFGVLMMAVVLRRDPSTASLHSARERIQDGRSEVIPEVERRASDLNAIGADHPLLDLIKQCLDNDPKRRPSARTIHEILHGIRTRLFPNAQRKPETDRCLDCVRSNQEVARLNNEVASVWSSLEHQIQTNLQTSGEKDSTIQELQVRLTETEETLTTTRDHEQELQVRVTETEETLITTRDHEQELQVRLTETEETLTTTRDHEQDLQVRLSEAQSILEVTRQEATRTQQDLQVRLSEAQNMLEATRQEVTQVQQEAASRAHELEEQILRERERAARERELLTAQLEHASSAIEKIKSAVFLERARQYNRYLANRFAQRRNVKSPFGEWKIVHTNLPGDAIWHPMGAVHANFLYVSFRTASLGCVLYRSTGKRDWERVAVPPDIFSCHGLLSYNNRLFSLFRPSTGCDPHEHLVLFELMTEDNKEKTISWKQLPHGRCPIMQHQSAVFAIKDKLVLAGGWNSIDSLSVVSEYSLQTYEWILPNAWPSLPKAVTLQHTVCLGDRWFFFGGYRTINENITANHMVFSVKVENGKPLGEFESISVPPTPNSECAACRVYNYAIVAGGFKSRPQDEVFLFNSSSQDWLQLPSLSLARSSPFLVLFKDSILCIGGYCGDRRGYCSTIEELSVKL